VATEVIIPRFGDSQVDITILEWKKQVGEAVSKGDILCELETDKATTDLESYADGVLLTQLVAPGDDVKTGQVIAYIGAEGEQAPEASREASSDPTAASSPAPAPRQERIEVRASASGVKASPKVRRLARQLGVDLASVTGTGPDGQITAEDVQNAAG
jgi:pyruvate dehydrogenase E2 component (dihydrolipoamide acetyltransferase)